MNLVELYVVTNIHTLNRSRLSRIRVQKKAVETVPLVAFQIPFNVKMRVSVSHIDPSTFSGNLFDARDAVRLGFLVRFSCTVAVYGAFGLVCCFRLGVRVLREDTVDFTWILGGECGPEVVNSLLGSLVLDFPWRGGSGALRAIIFIAGHGD